MSLNQEAIHEIDCFYTWVGPDMLWPHLVCSCGFKAAEETWADAGAAMDAHLSASKKGVDD